MPDVYIRCPSCAAELDYQQGRDTFYCRHCGTKIILKDAVGENVVREMDEAGLREREERKKAKEQRKKKWKKFSLIFLLVTVIVLTAGAVLLVLSDSFGDAGIAMAVIGSLLIVTGAFSLFALAFCFLGWIREMITGQDS